MALTQVKTLGLADGTDGQILTYDANGVVTTVGPGTDGQVLTSTGAGSPPAFEAVPAGVGGATGVDFNDGVKVRFGTGNDMEIYGQANNAGLITNAAGGIDISVGANPFQVSLSGWNTSGTPASNLTVVANSGANTYADLRYDGNVKLATTNTGISVTGGATFTGDVTWDSATNAGRDMVWDESESDLTFNDAAYIKMGDSDDLQLGHNGTSGFVTQSGSKLQVGPTSNHVVELLYGNAVKLSTESYGVWVQDDFKVIGAEGGGAQIRLVADEGDDNTDNWKIEADTSGSFNVRSYAGGSWQTELALDASGNLVATGNVTAYSDARLKTDIKTIDNALDKVTKLRGVSYKKLDTQAQEIGVIAQEVQNVVPEVVHDGAYQSVAYGNLVGLLIEAVKELKTELDAHKKKCPVDGGT